MATTSGVKEKLQKIIDQSERVTGKEFSTVTAATTELINGYQQTKLYEDAQDGEKLLDVYFASNRFVPVDDTNSYFNNGGVIYTSKGQVYTSARNLWRSHLADTFDPRNSRELLVEGSSCLGTDHRYVGYFPEFLLANRTYTYEFDYVRNYEKRHKFYFACGNFINEDDTLVTTNNCDSNMPCLAFELNSTDDTSHMLDYRFYRQSAGFVSDKLLFNRKIFPYSGSVNSEGILSTRIRVILEGGSAKTISLYSNTGVAVSNNRYWHGSAIPVKYTIYIVTQSEEVELTTKIASGMLYQPRDVGLVFGVGEYDQLSSNSFYGARNLSIYKGDIHRSRAAHNMFKTYNESTLSKVELGYVKNLRSNAFLGYGSDSNTEFDVTMYDVDTVGSCAFKDSLVKNIEFPVVRVIGNEAFASCNKLISVVLPKTLTHLLDQSFGNCESLEMVRFKKLPVAISTKAFENSLNLKTINVPWKYDEFPGAPWGALNASIYYEFDADTPRNSRAIISNVDDSDPLVPYHYDVNIYFDEGWTWQDFYKDSSAIVQIQGTAVYCDGHRLLDVKASDKIIHGRIYSVDFYVPDHT